MSATAHHSAPRGETVPNSLEPEHGWHCSHFFYRFDRRRLAKLRGDRLNEAREYFAQILDPESTSACPRQQGYIVAGHKADFAVMAMGPDPLQINRLHQAIMGGPFAGAIECTWSFVSISEISEYVPSPEQFAQGLIREGLDPESGDFQQRVAGYTERLPLMNHQRLKPQIPDWPAACFYPMNKSRVVGAKLVYGIV